MSIANMQINELRLRANGLTPEEARRWGEMVALRLSKLRINARASQSIAALKVRLPSGSGRSLDRMVDEIVMGIERSLGGRR